MDNAFHLPKNVTLSDITVRYGLQSESHVIPAEAKLLIIKQLIEAGFREMEVNAFAPPRFQPQFRDIETVVKGLPDRDDVIYSYVTTGRKAIELAFATVSKIISEIKRDKIVLDTNLWVE